MSSISSNDLSRYEETVEQHLRQIPVNEVPPGILADALHAILDPSRQSPQLPPSLQGRVTEIKELFHDPMFVLDPDHPEVDPYSQGRTPNTLAQYQERGRIAILRNVEKLRTMTLGDVSQLAEEQRAIREYIQEQQDVQRARRAPSVEASTISLDTWLHMLKEGFQREAPHGVESAAEQARQRFFEGLIQNPLFITNLQPELRTDHKIRDAFGEALRQRPEFLEYLSPDLQILPEFRPYLLERLRQNPRLITRLPQALRNDQEILDACREGIGQDRGALEDLSPDLQILQEFRPYLLERLRQNPGLIANLPPEPRNDQEIRDACREGLRQYPVYVSSIPPDLQILPEFRSSLLKYLKDHPEHISSLPQEIRDDPEIGQAYKEGLSKHESLIDQTSIKKKFY